MFFYFFFLFLESCGVVGFHGFVPFCVSVLLVYHMCLRVCQDRNTMNYTTPMLYFPTYALARALIVCSRSCSLNQSSGTIF